jgi:hypothetical protein
MGLKPIVGIFSVGLEEPYRWKDSVQSPAEIRLWAIDGIANGLRPWYTKFAGSVNDPRWLKPVERLYDWCAANERYLRNERSLARVGLVYSQQSAWFAGREPSRAMDDAANGFYHALVEARIPTGSTSPLTASRAGTGRRPSCGSPARWARTTSSS